MTVTNVQKDPDALTMTITASFDAPVERVWGLWSDPRQLERWWGPPTHPATFLDHDLSPGGAASYYMTGPGGERYHGWWRVEEVDPPHRLRLEDGFADADGKPNDAMPKTITTVTFSEADERTEMVIESRFASREDMEKILEMGAEEGMTLAIGQMDELLRDDTDRTS